MKPTKRKPPSSRTQFGPRAPRGESSQPKSLHLYHDDVLNSLDAAAEPLTQEELAQALGIAKRELQGFREALRALEIEGVIVRNRAGSLLVAKRIAALAGRIEGHPDGHGFLVPDERGATPPVFLSATEMRQVLHGDRASVRVTGRDARGRPTGAIVEVLERSSRPIVGRLRTDHGVVFLAPEDRRICQDILVPAGELGNAKSGEVVSVELIAHPSRTAQPMARVVEVLGKYADIGSLAAVHTYSDIRQGH